MSTQQFGFMKGLRLFGDAGYHVTVKELEENLVGRNYITMLSKNEITKDIRLKSMGYLLFLKRKRCGKVKSRGCVDGRPQREFLLREDCTTPTISLHELMATCIIDALEERKAVCVDIPGAFLQADLEPDEKYYVKITNVMVDMLCKSFPEYKDKIIYGKNGRKYLYCKLNKAVYGTLVAARRWNDKLNAALNKWKFKKNPYDECCWNKLKKIVIRL